MSLDELKEKSNRLKEESDRVMLKANILIMNIAFEDKDFETSASASERVLEIDNDNPTAKFILFWSNYRNQIIYN